MTGRIAIVIPRAGIGPIVTPLHSAGVPDYTHRYVPGRLGVVAGTDITSIPDLGTAGVPLVPTGNGTNKIQSAGGYSFAELTASADATANYNLQGATTSYAPQMTIAAVVQADSGPFRLYESEALNLTRATDGRFQASRTNGTQGAALIAGDSTWQFVMAQVDATAGTILIRKGASEVTGTLGTIQSGAVPPRMGGNGGVASRVGRVAEGISWNRILTADERTAVYNAMKAKYTAWL